MKNWCAKVEKWFDRQLRAALRAKPISFDLMILPCFVFIITLHPFYLQDKINIFEAGLYLPGIDAVLKGLIPYRDFFHLRGPVELYIPAFFMKLFGENFAVLPTYFYVGTVVTLIVGVFIAKELFQSRLFLYLMVPVFIARAFPRVSFSIGGGMRFVFGALAIWCAVKYLQKGKKIWLWASGVCSAVGLFTSIEIGAYALVGVMGSLFLKFLLKKEDRKKVFREVASYAAGLGLITVPFVLYLEGNQALLPYLKSVFNVLTNMLKVFPQVDKVPSNLLEVLSAMAIPGNTNFKHLTPAYCYMAVIFYIIYRGRNKKLSAVDYGIICLGLYGLVIYIAAFRSLGGPAFEMALQPEKILLFLMIERAFLYLNEQKNHIPEMTGRHRSAQGIRLKKYGIPVINLFFIAIILSSVIYPIQRYNKRFFAFKFISYKLTGRDTQVLRPLWNEPSTALNMGRLKGMVVPSWQAQDFTLLNDFITKRTAIDEPILFFPELGAYHFIVNRPFIGRFPMVTLSWIGADEWHGEFMMALKKAQPRYAVTYKILPPYFEKWSFAYPGNKQKFDEVEGYIERNYRIVFSTPSLNIYGRSRDTK